MPLSEEQIVVNFERYQGMLLDETGDPSRRPRLEAMLDALGDRLATCPASSKLSFHNAFPGGLIDHSLRVLHLSRRLARAYGSGVTLPPDGSIVLASLLHDLGKVGNLDEDRYLPQTNGYYRDRGNVYEVNASMRYLTVPHASLFLLQHFGVVLTHDEWTALLLADGPGTDDGREYSMREGSLAMLVSQADRVACEVEKVSSSI